MGGGIATWLLYRSGEGDLSLSSLVVPPGAVTPVHDHLAWGLVGLYAGEQDEQVYRRRDGYADDHAQLDLVERNHLRPGDFYLPYLGIVSDRGIDLPAKVDRFGYHSLATLAFEPDELQVIVEGARRVEQVGDPVLATEARQAIRKLAFDLPLGATDAPEDES